MAAIHHTMPRNGSYIFTMLYLCTLYAVAAAFGYGLYLMSFYLLDAISNPMVTRFAAHWGTANTNDGAMVSYAILTVGISALLWIARRLFIPSASIDELSNVYLPRILDGLFNLLMWIPMLAMILFFGAGVIFFTFFAGIPLATVFLLNPIHAAILALLTAMPFIVGGMQIAKRS